MDAIRREQLYFEDVAVGDAIPPLVKKPTTRQLVKWAGASADFVEIHYDKDVALAKDLPGVIVHGRLKAAFLGQMLTDWMGEWGDLKKFACQYRGIDQPGDTLTCAGVVTSKCTEGGENLVDCEVWIENDKGKKTTTGMATVQLPSRAEGHKR